MSRDLPDNQIDYHFALRGERAPGRPETANSPADIQTDIYGDSRKKRLERNSDLILELDRIEQERLALNRAIKDLADKIQGQLDDIAASIEYENQLLEALNAHDTAQLEKVLQKAGCKTSLLTPDEIRNLARQELNTEQAKQELFAEELKRNVEDLRAFIEQHPDIERYIQEPSFAKDHPALQGHIDEFLRLKQETEATFGPEKFESLLAKSFEGGENSLLDRLLFTLEGRGERVEERSELRKSFMNATGQIDPFQLEQDAAQSGHRTLEEEPNQVSNKPPSLL